MDKNPGYDDTPILPHVPYRVHDSARPAPRVVASGEWIGQPPADAVMLFDGSNLDGWAGKDEGPAQWKVEHGYLEVVAGTGDIHTRAEFGDCQLHVEWATPWEVSGDSQGRGNSGIFLMGRYEVQVLDCFENPTYADGTTGAVYGQHPPLVNACRRPGEWQAYDIIWEAPRFDGDLLVKPAFITVLLNGIVLHHRTELIGFTSHKNVGAYSPHPPVGPLKLQDHGNPVRFKNIWYRPLTGYDER